MSRRHLIPLVILALVAFAPAVRAGGKKDKVARVSFHMEASPTDNPKMIFQQNAAGKMRVFSRVPDISTDDIASFAPFPSDEGDYGLMFVLKPPAKRRIEATTRIAQGRYIVSKLNGRVVDAVKIEQPVEDGKLVIWKGATLADIAALEQSFPRIGQEKKKKKK